MTQVFFVEKKYDKKKIVQNYRYVNKWIIENNYQSYNNIQIKEKDKWKAAFMTSERLFKLTVMFLA